MKITESALRTLVSESIKRVLKENISGINLKPYTAEELYHDTSILDAVKANGEVYVITIEANGQQFMCSQYFNNENEAINMAEQLTEQLKSQGSNVTDGYVDIFFYEDRIIESDTCFYYDAEQDMWID